jgi:hypothetical protein
MSCQCEPHGKMAADGARTENANSHEVDIPQKRNARSASFHKPATLRNR